MLLDLVSWWVFLPALFFAAAMITAAEFESGSVETLLLVALGLYLWYFRDFNVLTWAEHSPGTAIAYVAGYFVLGALYSLYKWWSYMRDNREAFLDSFSHQQKLDRISDDVTLEEARASFIREHVIEKSMLLFWMTWWVPCLVVSLVGDVFVKAWKKMYAVLEKTYGTIAYRVLFK